MFNNSKESQSEKREGIPPPSGNRCGHDPGAPRWFEPPADHAPRPPIIRKWIDRVRQFFGTPAKIPSLENAHHARKVAADPLGAHKPRQMRSERREACCSLLGAIAHYCDLPTLCLSVPQPDGVLLPVRMDTLADRAGLSMRRAERAMRDIVDAGLVSVHKRCELQDDGTYIGRAAVRVLPPSFFGLFGLEARLEHDRRRIRQQRIKERETRKPTRTEGARIKTAIAGVLNTLRGPCKAAQPNPPATAATTVELTKPEGSAADHVRNLKAILSGDPQQPGPQQRTARVGGDQHSAIDAEPEEAQGRARGRGPP